MKEQNSTHVPQSLAGVICWRTWEGIEIQNTARVITQVSPFACAIACAFEKTIDTSFGKRGSKHQNNRQQKRTSGESKRAKLHWPSQLSNLSRTGARPGCQPVDMARVGFSRGEIMEAGADQTRTGGSLALLAGFHSKSPRRVPPPLCRRPGQV